jgi:hypothetical protein
MGDRRGAYGFGWVNLRNTDYLENLVVDGRIILKSILKKFVGRTYKGLLWLRRGRSGGLL